MIRVKTAAAVIMLFLASCGPSTYSSESSRAEGTAAEEVHISSPTPEDAEILAEGVAAVTISRAMARDQALDDALRKAVEQGVGTFITSETMVRNFQLIQDNIYSDSRGYVSSYRIVDEEVDDDLYRVVIRARVKSGMVEDDLAAIGILLEEQGRPRVMVLMREVVDISDLDDLSIEGDVFETRVMEHFRGRGFPVVDAATVRRIIQADQLKLILQGDDETARLVGLQTGAEIVVTGAVQHQVRQRSIAGSLRDIHAYTGSTRAVNTNTGALLAASGFTLEIPFSESAARDRAADSTAVYLENQILETWTRGENVTVLKVTGADYEKLRELRTAVLSDIRGVTDVFTRDLTGSMATLEIVSETSTEEVTDALAQIPGLTVTGFSGSRVEITLD